jgi:uncharacterized protein
MSQAQFADIPDLEVFWKSPYGRWNSAGPLQDGIVEDNRGVTRITPSDLVPDPMTLDLRLEPGAVDYARDVRQIGPLTVKGTADRIEEHRGPRDIVEDIRLRAHIAGDFEMLCARCLQPVGQHVDQHFDLIFRPAGADSDQSERSISEAETEIGYYETSGLLLEDAVREQVLLSLPDRSLCREDCKGLCPHCGANLNETTCNCGEQIVDPRWGALQGFGEGKSSGK